MASDLPPTRNEVQPSCSMNTSSQAMDSRNENVFTEKEPGIEHPGTATASSSPSRPTVMDLSIPYERVQDRLSSDESFLLSELEATENFAMRERVKNLINPLMLKKDRYAETMTRYDLPIIPCALYQVHRSPNISASVFVMEPEALIPLHAHPGAMGLVRVMAGSATIRSFSPLSAEDDAVVRQAREIDPRAVLYERKATTYVRDPEAPVPFFLTEGNAHEIRAGHNKTVVFEIQVKMPGTKDYGFDQTHSWSFFDEILREIEISQLGERIISCIIPGPPDDDFYHLLTTDSFTSEELILTRAVGI